MIIEFIIIIGLFILLFVIFTIFLCFGCLGLTGSATKLITKYLIPFGIDRVYQETSLPINTECYICLQNIKHQVVATCNHSYCGKCICDYIISNEGAIKCPACRLDIIVLYRKFQPKTVEQKNIKKFISQYNHKYSKQPTFWRSFTQLGSTIRGLPLLLTLKGLRFILTNNRIKYLLVLLCYTLSPIDFVPEMIFGPIGLIDDSFALINILIQMGNVLRQYASQEAQSDD